MSKHIEAIILDWAGTTIDFGCFAPVEAFMNAFHHFSIYPTIEETRAPMGLQKRDHIKAMIFGERLSAQYFDEFGRIPSEKDIDDIYHCFEPALMSVLRDFGGLLPNVQDTVLKVRKKGIKIGSTTGYTKQMMDVLIPIAKQNGYEPDCLVCPEKVGGIGRPYPYMIWSNLQELGVADIRNVVKIGDTAADIAEGKNAGCITVGVIHGSSMLGLSQISFKAESPVVLKKLCEEAKQKFFLAGADHVITELSDLPDLLEKLEREEL